MLESHDAMSPNVDPGTAHGVHALSVTVDPADSGGSLNNGAWRQEAKVVINSQIS